MSTRFSLVYPTRHRPTFIRRALRFLEQQKYPQFEVIVSDNYVDPALSCEQECRNSPVPNLKYVRPPSPLGMVEHWNYALQFATGDYVCYFTDKMFLLPGALSMANTCIQESRSEIVTWIYNWYHPKQFPDYLGEGVYSRGVASVSAGADFSSYDPVEELSLKGRADVARTEQSRSSYARGKICFGAYSADLCARIIGKSGALFHTVSPDYTSMILGLSVAKSAAEIRQPGIVTIDTDLSNGHQMSLRDEVALKFLAELGNPQEILSGYLVPGLYCSLHNAVAHDYLALRKEYGLTFDFDAVNWLVYITEDVDIEGRRWSSKEVEKQQRSLLQGSVDRLPQSEQDRYSRKLEKRAKDRRRVRGMQSARKAIRAVFPEWAIKRLRRWLRRPQFPPEPQCAKVEDVLQIETGDPENRGSPTVG